MGPIGAHCAKHPFAKRTLRLCPAEGAQQDAGRNKALRNGRSVSTSINNNTNKLTIKHIKP